MFKKLFIIFLLVFIFIFQSVQADDLSSIKNQLQKRFDIQLITDIEARQKTVQELIKQPLDEDKVLQVAMLNNASLWANVLELPVVIEELNQIRRPENPEISGKFLKSNSSTDRQQLSFEQNLLSLILFPVRGGVADSKLNQKESEIVKVIFDFSTEVRKTYYHFQKTKQSLNLLQHNLQTAQAAKMLSEKQFEAGNIGELELRFQQNLFDEFQVEFSQKLVEAKLAELELRKLMGISDNSLNPEFVDYLSELPDSEPVLQNLISITLENNPEMKLQKNEIELLEKELTLARWHLLGSPVVGVETEKETGTADLFGPILRFQFPLFDLGQTQPAIIDAKLHQAKVRYQGLELNVQSEIKQKLESLSALRNQTKLYREVILPERTRILELTQQHYNYMLLGVYQLIEAKQKEFGAQLKIIDSLAQYWMTWSELERIVGQKISVDRKPAVYTPLPSQKLEKPIIPDKEDNVSPQKQEPSQPMPQHHHH